MESISMLTIKPIVILMETIYFVSIRVLYIPETLILISVVINSLFLILYNESELFVLKLHSKLNKGKHKTIAVLTTIIPSLLLVLNHLAAFSFFSEMKSLSGQKFAVISDIGKADGLIMIFGRNINVFPITFLITAIMVTIIASKALPADKILRTVTFVGLFISLYNNQAVLSLYWCIFVILYTMTEVAKKVSLSVKKNRKKSLNDENKKVKEYKPNPLVFFLGIIYFIVFTGLFIPSNIIKSSPVEFIDSAGMLNPLHYLLFSVLLSLGTFAFWISLYYLFGTDVIKVLLERLVWIAAGIASVNYIAAGSVWGEVEPELIYNESIEFEGWRIILSVVVSFLIGVGLYILMEKKISYMKILIFSELSVLLISVIFNSAKIQKEYSAVMKTYQDYSETEILNLSKNGKNVIVFILDRALAVEVPFIFDEKPELKKQFDGFTYYPNTISYGAYTISGCTPIYGGYEYTPEEMNRRNQESMKDKQNEALRVMPVLFGNEGFNVTVCDPVYAGYKFIPDLSIYEDCPGVQAYNTDGMFNSLWPKDMLSREVLLRRNFFFHSMMKIAPLNWQLLLYNDGFYCNPEYEHPAFEDNRYQAEGYQTNYMDEYSKLAALPMITGFEDNDENNLLILYNYATHQNQLLQEPEYEPKRSVDNREYKKDSKLVLGEKTINMNTYNQISHYQVNMATYIKLGEWFDYLRENDCYNNTRIILVADHGWGVMHTDVHGDVGKRFEAEEFLPLLMVKDFDAKGFSESDVFMTNADTPSLAMKGLIENPKNPFTGKTMDGNEKYGDIHVYYSSKCNPKDNPGNVFNEGNWFSLKGRNPYVLDNWSYIGKY